MPRWVPASSHPASHRLPSLEYLFSICDLLPVVVYVPKSSGRQRARDERESAHRYQHMDFFLVASLVRREKMDETNMGPVPDGSGSTAYSSQHGKVDATHFPAPTPVHDGPWMNTSLSPD